MTKHTRPPRARYTGFSGVELTFPYHAGLVDRLKRQIPAYTRVYDPDDKAGTITAAHAIRAKARDALSDQEAVL